MRSANRLPHSPTRIDVARAESENEVVTVMTWARTTMMRVPTKPALANDPTHPQIEDDPQDREHRGRDHTEECSQR